MPVGALTTCRAGKICREKALVLGKKNANKTADTTHIPLNWLILPRAGSDVAGEQSPGKGLGNSNLKVDRHREEALKLTEDHPK